MEFKFSSSRVPMDEPLDDLPSSSILQRVRPSGDYSTRIRRRVSNVEQYPQSFSRNDMFYVGREASTPYPRSDTVVSGNSTELNRPEVIGHVVSGDDGQYYVVIDDQSSTDFEPLNSGESLVNYDDDTAIFLDDNDEQHHSPYSIENSEVGECVSSVHSVQQSPATGDADNYDIVDDIRSEVADEMRTRFGKSSEQVARPVQKRRVAGYYQCPHCGQSFINMTRLERHLAVHQIFGSFMCAACGKSYKYEYNLFHHWRKTCKELDSLIQSDVRQDMDIGTLKKIVENSANKNRQNPSNEIGINRKLLYDDSQSRGDVNIARRSNECPYCGIVFLTTHLHQHGAVHKGQAKPDTRSASGLFHCDLCGLMFRRHFNLLNHWRAPCFVISNSLPENVESPLSDEELLMLVENLMRKSLDASQQMNFSGSTKFPGILASGDIDAAGNLSAPNINKGNYVTAEQDRSSTLVSTADRWTDDSRAVNEEAANVEEVENAVTDEPATAESSSKWPLTTGPVQCSECFRSFANTARLERHLAGVHSSIGTHTCVLCGSRFKYDYNLLNHYRRYCHYTKTHLDQDLRETLDATALRKTVRILSKSEGLNTNSSTIPTASHSVMDGDAITNKKQSLRFPASFRNPPPQLLLPRPGLSNGKQCPLCSVFFYGESSLERHIKTAHATDEDFKHRKNGCFLYEARKPTKIIKVSETVDSKPFDDATDIDRPPELIPEEPIAENEFDEAYTEGAHQVFMDDHGNRRFIEDNGALLRSKIKKHIVGIDDLTGVEQFVTSGGSNMQHGNQFYIAHNELNGYDSLLSSIEKHDKFITHEATGSSNLNQRRRIEGIEQRKQLAVGDELELRAHHSADQMQKSFERSEDTILEGKFSYRMDYDNIADDHGNREIKCTRLAKISPSRKSSQ